MPGPACQGDGFNARWGLRLGVASKAACRYSASRRGLWHRPHERELPGRTAHFTHFSPVSRPLAAGASGRLIPMWRLLMRKEMLVRLAISLVPLIVLVLPGCTSVKMTGSAHRDRAALADRHMG